MRVRGVRSRRDDGVECEAVGAVRKHVVVELGANLQLGHARLDKGAHMRESLSDEINASIYARRKIDNEPVFGRMKAHFGVGRFMVRGLRKVKIETGLVMMAMNMAIMAG